MNFNTCAKPRLGHVDVYAFEAGVGGTAVLNRGSSTGRRPSQSGGALADARAAYEDFFTPWKDADPDVPFSRK